MDESASGSHDHSGVTYRRASGLQLPDLARSLSCPFKVSSSANMALCLISLFFSLSLFFYIFLSVRPLLLQRDPLLFKLGYWPFVPVWNQCLPKYIGPAASRGQWMNQLYLWRGGENVAFMIGKESVNSLGRVVLTQASMREILLCSICLNYLVEKKGRGE